MEVKSFSNLSEIKAYFTSFEGQKKVKHEKFISSESVDIETLYFHGFCESCDSYKKFTVDWKYSDQIEINFRERLECETCHLNSRQRLMVGVIKNRLKEKTGKDIYFYEQVTPLYKKVKSLFTEHEIIGSEYLGYDIPKATIIEGIRHEDALNLSFDSKTFDMIVSNDVYEHVPDYIKCFEEAHRVLKDDGELIFTIPFHMFKETTIQRSKLVNGVIEHILPAEYHGNPIADSEGSLVFFDYAWDFIDVIKEIGFNIEAKRYYSLFYGYMGRGLIFTVTKRT